MYAATFTGIVEVNYSVNVAGFMFERALRC